MNKTVRQNFICQCQKGGKKKELDKNSKDTFQKK